MEETVAPVKAAKPRKPKRFRIGEFYKVTWHDIVTDRGWVPVGGEKLAPAVCTTFGWCTGQATKAVTFSSTRGDNTDGSDLEYNPHICIPIGCIDAAEVMKL